MSLKKLDLSVALKLAFVEDSLAKVEEYRTMLHHNAQKVKEEIHEVVDRQVGSLRMRERQLVRQVEVVTAHETCRLGTQQARLMHNKGALSATSDLLQCCASTDTNTLAKIKVDEMYYSQGVQPAKHVSVQLDESALSSAISQFGSVQLPDTITHHPSPVIPVKVEEYEDEEHDVLHKSVAGAACEPSSGGSAPLHIKVQFPRLHSHSGWLFNVDTAAAAAAAAAAADDDGAHTPIKPQATPQNKSEDVAAWLGDLQLSSAAAGDDNSNLFPCGEGFDMVGMPAASEGSSIEIVSHPYSPDKEYQSSPSSVVCEVENPYLVNDRSHWLSSKMPAGEANKAAEELDIVSVCQANETCCSFDDCLCQNICQENALEKLQQSADFRAKTGRKRTFSEAEGVHSILTHMGKILSSENSQWLLKKKQEGGDLPRPAKGVMYRPPGDQWLHQRNGSPTKTFLCAQLSTHSSTWLLKNLKNQMNVEEKNEKEKEEETNKDNRITSEALSEALKRVRLDPAKNKACDIDDSHSNVYSCLPSLTIQNQAWLLGRNVDSSKQLYRDTDWQDENDKATTKLFWLYSPSEFCPEKSGGSVCNVTSKLQESLLSPVQSEAKSWLLH